MLNRVATAVMATVMAATCVAAVAQRAQAQTAAAGDSAPTTSGNVELGAPYVDLYHGFSLCPPAGAQRSNERTPSQLVSWTLRDDQGKAVVGTLAVDVVPDKQQVSDLSQFSQTLADTLKQKENFTILSNKVVRLAGKDAVDLKGETGDTVRWWQRQVWVQTDGRGFLTLRLTGPTAMSDRLDAVMSAILATVKVIDPKEARAQRDRNLQAGVEFLKNLSAKQVAAALAKEPHWYLMQRDGKDVGYMMIAESPSSSDGVEGFEVKIKVGYISGRGEVSSTLTAFAASDRQAESWKQEVGIHADGAVSRSLQTGSLGGGEIRCELSKDGKSRTVRKRVPPNMYLPLAMTTLLPQLVDLNRNGSYSFARYTPEANAFDVHTLTVLGKEKIDLGGKPTQVVRAEVQSAEDVGADIVWLDAGGNIVRLRGASGTTMELSDKAEVVKKYPQADRTE